MKKKLNPDDIAMIIADWEDGELTTCEGIECDNCPLDKQVPLPLRTRNSISICNLIMEMSLVMSEVEHD